MPKLERIKGWIILGVSVFFLGCASTEDVRILDGEIYRLHSQLNKLQKEGEFLKNELTVVKEELQKEVQKEVQKDISILKTDLSRETKRLQADLSLRLEALQSEIRILSTGVEEYKEFLKKPSKEIDRVREDIGSRTRHLEEKWKMSEEKSKAQENRTKALEERIKGMEDRLKGLEGKIDLVASKQVEMEKLASAKEVPPVSAEVKGVSTGAGDLYKNAYETFQKGEFEGARTKFEAFLKRYPNTELSDNAQFWIGETYYLKKDFEKAILEYEKVIVKYPEGDKVPAALLKQALAFLELGDKTNSKNLLKRVIERYPHSDQAEIAKKRLEGIK